MARSLGNILGDSLQLGLGYAERLLVGIEPGDFARLARPGGQLVQSNHPAFLLGHLSLYPPRIVDHLGGDGSAIACGSRFSERFSKDATCQDDPDSSIYPAMGDVTEAFFRGYRVVLETLRQAPDEAFAGVNPLEGAMREKFPTVGSMHAFYVGGHLMLHLGQMSAWRRMMGLPPA